jgi:acyl carrier protein
MNIQEIKQKTSGVVLTVLPNLRPEELSDDQNIFSLGLNSINAMALVSSLEDAFDITFETSEINFENFQTVTDIVELIRQKQGIYSDLK